MYVLFGLVKPELGLIPSGQKKIFNSEHLIFPGKELSVTDIIVYWPPTRPNIPFRRRRKCIFLWRGWAWLTIWDRVKIPGYSHKLMHRKRVICELHDSYFRSITIKHAIPKTAEVHITMSSYGRYWVGVELLYNSVHRKSVSLETRRVGDNMR